MAEIWKPVANTNWLYEASDHGRIRSLRNVSRPRVLTGDTDPKGYSRVMIAGKHRRVARLVCEAFHGPCPEGHECAHLDGDKSNNAAGNLAWVTRSENNCHTVLHGHHVGSRHLTPGVGRGEQNPNCKYSDALIAEMRASGMGARRLSQAYGISKSHAGRILAGADREAGDAPTGAHP